jgi:hypothetical protein
LPDKALDKLLPILNACISLGYTPKTWRKSDVVFIPKPSKKRLRGPEGLQANLPYLLSFQGP